LIDQILEVFKRKAATEQEIKFSEDQCLDLVRFVYHCIGTGIMQQKSRTGLKNLQTVAFELYNLLRPAKVNNKVTIGADRFKFSFAQAIAKTLLQIVNYELLTSPDSADVQRLITQMHEDVMLIEEQPESRKGSKKTEQCSFLTLVFEPLLKLRVTVPVIVNAVNQTENHVSVTQLYKQQKQPTDASTILPIDSLTKDNVDMFTKALR
jgi:hypothetical protein